MEIDPQDTNPAASAHIEVKKLQGCTLSDPEIEKLIQNFLTSRGGILLSGAIDVKEIPELVNQVEKVMVDTDFQSPLWDTKLNFYFYQLNEEGPYDETSEDDPNSTVFTHWDLPCRQFDGLWENLIFESSVKEHLLEFSSSSLLFSSCGVDHNIISWNHVVLLHGPPGTGKTSLCQALAQKLSVRLGHVFKDAQLLEVNSHSLFSKWFSESGKLVGKLFSYIQELAEDENSLVFILIDEVESLAAARSAAASGTEPSDAIRVVNALLTQIDRLKCKKNVMILTTSNITEAIDLAFVDRADIRQFIGLPSSSVRKAIVSSCVSELERSGIIFQQEEDASKVESLLDECAECTDGLSGRGLRKLPFQAHARFIRRPSTSKAQFLSAVIEAAKLELASSMFEKS